MKGNQNKMETRKPGNNWPFW